MFIFLVHHYNSSFPSFPDCIFEFVFCRNSTTGRATLDAWCPADPHATHDAQGAVTGSLQPGTFYQLLVAINGLNVIVSINGTKAFNYTFAPRILTNGDQVALNKGMVGFGSNNSQSLMDNVALQVLPPNLTLDRTEYFDDGTAADFSGYQAGAWGVTTGRYVGSTTLVDPTALSTVA